MIAQCPLCGAAAPPPFLHRARVPVHQNRPEPTPDAARAVPCGTLAMVACDGCGFVYNAAFDPALLRYGPGYDNAQAHSPAFAAHLDALAAHLVQVRGVRGARIVEVGCGQGDFLRRLVAWPGAGNVGIGFDPSYGGPEADGALRFERRLYGPDSADTQADIVVCRHVIEHLADPLALLRAVRAALRQAPRARVFFETPDVAWSLRHIVLWDFFYEHCSLFSAGSLAGAFARAGFADIAVSTVFGGQYLWAEAGLGTAPLPEGPGDIATLARAYAAAEPAKLAAWHARLFGLDGPVALWGAGAKGVTLANLVDPDGTKIDCVVDINPAKQGKFIPGSGHAIVAPASLAARGVRQVVAMNPAYRTEILAALPGCGNPALVEWDD